MHICHSSYSILPQNLKPEASGFRMFSRDTERDQSHEMSQYCGCTNITAQQQIILQIGSIKVGEHLHQKRNFKRKPIKEGLVFKEVYSFKKQLLASFEWDYSEQGKF